MKPQTRTLIEALLLFSISHIQRTREVLRVISIPRLDREKHTGKPVTINEETKIRKYQKTPNPNKRKK